MGSILSDKLSLNKKIKLIIKSRPVKKKSECVNLLYSSFWIVFLSLSGPMLASQLILFCVGLLFPERRWTLSSIFLPSHVFLKALVMEKVDHQITRLPAWQSNC